MIYKNINKDRAVCPFCDYEDTTHNKKIYQLVQCVNCNKEFELYVCYKIKDGDYALSYNTSELVTNKSEYEGKIVIRNKHNKTSTTFIASISSIEIPYEWYNMINSSVSSIEEMLTRKGYAPTYIINNDHETQKSQ